MIGKRNPGVTAKDMILGVIAKYGTDFATGYVIEYTGESIRELDDGRAYDGLQHVHRRWSKSRIDCSR